MKENSDKKSNGGIVNNFYGNINNYYENHGTINNYGSQQMMKNEAQAVKKDVMPPTDQLIQAVGKVLNMFWGNSSYAVLFCVCRDYFGYPNNMSMFESEFTELFDRLSNDYKCPLGTIGSAFSHNSFLKLHVERWKESGVKQRALQLAYHFKAALSEQYPAE